jgi:GH24 family phage-related lysozyme (muramidase)
LKLALIRYTSQREDLMLDTTTYLPILTGFEGSVPWMYLDTAANVTVGVGNLLANVAEAQALAFVVRPADGSDPAQAPAATPDQIETDFNAVSAQPKGQNFHYYQQFTALVLPDAAIQALLLNRVQGFVAQLTGAFLEFNAYPAPACAAIFDMAFNLGLGGLLRGFPHFTQAVRSQDWATAAAQCTRGGIQPSRNAWTAAQFQLAASSSDAS